MESNEQNWLEEEVTDVFGAKFIIRTYIEQADLRRYLTHISALIQLDHACDIGAGYGRLSPVLSEFSENVVAFEREKSLCDKGSFLLPTADYRQIDTLKSLPASDDEFDLALTFTVLQHLWDDLAKAAISEIQRIVRPGGYVLICEETDESEEYACNIEESHSAFIGRSLEKYKKWMTPFHLTKTSPRSIERGYERGNVGAYMLFRAPGR